MQYLLMRTGADDTFDAYDDYAAFLHAKQLHEASPTHWALLRAFPHGFGGGERGIDVSRYERGHWDPEIHHFPSRVAGYAEGDRPPYLSYP